MKKTQDLNYTNIEILFNKLRLKFCFDCPIAVGSEFKSKSWENLIGMTLSLGFMIAQGRVDYILYLQL